MEWAADMRRLIALLAARCAGMINMAKLAGELTITEPTVRAPEDSRHRGVRPPAYEPGTPLPTLRRAYWPDRSREEMPCD